MRFKNSLLSCLALASFFAAGLPAVVQAQDANAGHGAEAAAPENAAQQPAKDVEVQVTWLQPNGDPFVEQSKANYNDFDTEKKPVKAKVSVKNVGREAVPGNDITVKLNIPEGWKLEPLTDNTGWTCNTLSDGRTIGCTRQDNLEANQQAPFEFYIVSPGGNGDILPKGPLTITGAYGDNRAINVPSDTNAANDTVNASASVFKPNPDFSPSLSVKDTYLAPGKLTKAFTVDATYTGDAVRATELSVRLEGTAGATFPSWRSNGWECAAVTNVLSCTYKHELTASTIIPPIEGSIRFSQPEAPSYLKATTRFTRVGIRVAPQPDSNPKNDNSTVTFKPFNEWADAGVKVSFANPTPGSGQDAGTKVTISHVDGGKIIPSGTKVQVTGPATMQVKDSSTVNNCRKLGGTAEGSPVTFECEIVTAIERGKSIDGPTITGVTGAGKTVNANVVFEGLNDGLDPKLENNRHSATTREPYSPPAPAPAPAPVPPVKPGPSEEPTATPEPDPAPSDGPKAEDRPKDIPPAPKAPATPAPVTPGHTPAVKKAEVRSKEWAEAVFPENTRAKKVLIGRDNVFADSLSSGGLQGILDAPLLLNPVGALAEETKASLKKLKPEEVVILGGPAAQSPAVEAELKQLGWKVSRVAGETRVETAIAAATAHAPAATHAVLARAYAATNGSGTQAFADALAGGAMAARQERPVFLTPTGELTDSLRAYLKESKIKTITLVGSTAAISPAVEAELKGMGIATNRIAGANRAETAVKVANALGYWHAGEAQSVLVVNGEREDAWTDAFPAALYAKRYEVPVVLSGSEKLLPETQDWLAPGTKRKKGTRVICSLSVGDVKQCGYNPGKAPKAE